MASKSKQKVTFIDPPKEPLLGLPRVHPGDKALVDKLLLPLSDKLPKEQLEKMTFDIAKAAGLPKEALLELPKEEPGTQLPPTEKTLYDPFTRAEIEIRNRYGVVNNSVTGLLKGILTELVIQRIYR